MFFLNCDGGSRGNPGPSSSGAVLFDDNEKIIDSVGEYLGIKTNNYAEYNAVSIGIKMALKNAVEDITIRLDSQLIVRQMSGMYKIKSPHLILIQNEINGLLKYFTTYQFKHVYREFNKDADSVVNEVLDKQKLNS